MVTDNTIRGSGLRKLIVAHYIWGSRHEAYHHADAIPDLDANLTGLHEDFLAELAAAAIRRVWDGKTRDPFKGSSRQYHDVEEVKKAAGKK